MGVEDAEVADLFAGTGSLGIEALSRGAAHADFVEANERQVAVIRANLAAAKVADRARVLHMTVERGLERLDRRYDIVLMDPPYAQPFPVQVVEQLGVMGRLNQDAIVVVGHATRVPAPERCGALALWQDRRYGDSSLAFYRMDAEDAA
jgi:16S rRNA (guanine(966)-N(2))-methyltransferase RsmD